MLAQYIDCIQQSSEGQLKTFCSFIFFMMSDRTKPISYIYLLDIYMVNYH